MLICDRDGKWQLTTSRRPFATTGWSRFWGALLEALVNGAESAGLDQAFRSWLKGALVPGSSVLLLVLAGDDGERMVEMLTPFGGEVMSSPLGEDLPERWGVQGLRFSG